MSKPFDSVFKDLLERDPAGWLNLAFGPLEGEPEIVDADISTVSGAADKVIRLHAPEPFIAHFEAFASWDPTILARAMNYNGIHHRRHALPVDTVLIVLRREADHPSLFGEYRVKAPATGRHHTLEYGVIRAWTLDLEAVLEGSLATLPLAPLTDAAVDKLPDVLYRMEQRFATEVSPEARKDLWTDTFVLLGLRYSRQNVAQLFRGKTAMRESDTYQAILEEGIEVGREKGVASGVLRSLLIIGSIRLGEPPTELRKRLEAETDLSRLEQWLRSVTEVESWTELPGL